MADVDEPLALGIAFPVEVVVPRHELRERVLEERSHARVVSGVPVDAKGGRGVNRRLDYAAGPGVRRGVGVLVSVPKVYAGEVPAEVGV